VDFFGSQSGSFFGSESNIVALYSNLFEKLDKSEMKNKTYILIFQTQKTLPKG